MEINTENVNVEDSNKSRKRKLDKDGFVCPSTPDIPKSSHQYVENKNLVKYKGVDCVTNFPNFGGDLSETDAVSEYFRPISGVDNPTFEENGYNGSPHKGENFPNTSDNVGHMPFESEPASGINETKPIFQEGQNNTSNSVFLSRESVGELEEEVTYSLPNEEGAATQESKSLLQSLFRGFEQDTLSIMENWNKTFRQCEEFETESQQKLGDLMDRAKSMEDNLISKKDILCNRLRGIGKTLETM